MSRGRGRSGADDSEIEVAEGRPEPTAPFSRLGDWVMLALQARKLRPPALALYWALCAHLNASRGDRKVWPTQDTLAAMLGYSEGNKIAPYLRELVALGAIEVIKKPVPGGGGRKRSLYVIHKTPPPDYDGFESLPDFYADRGARETAARTAAMTAPPTPAADDSAANSTESPGPHMSTRPGAEMSTRAGCSNEHLNQTKKPDEENQNGGACRRPPEPPADLPAGRAGHLVALSGDQRSNQLTVRARFLVERAAVRACSLCDDAGIAPGGESCPHPPEYALPQAPLSSTLPAERGSAG